MSAADIVALLIGLALVTFAARYVPNDNSNPNEEPLP
jgi:hypothetical protein